MRWALLTASEYFAKALVTADDDVIPATFARQQAAFESYIDASAGRFVRLPIPYEGTALPGYLLRPDDSGAARPTLIVTNGSDGSLAGMFAHAGDDALARGWNVFLYDGPGQQSMLFQRGVPFRPDWEAVLTPVVDALLARPEVDPSALLGYGVSQGGYWLPRALAFEHRLAAAVADGGVVDVAATWNKNLPAPVLDLLRTGQKDAFNQLLGRLDADPARARDFAFRARPYGRTDPFDTFTEVQKYQLRDVAHPDHHAHTTARVDTAVLVRSADGTTGALRRAVERYPTVRVGGRAAFATAPDAGGPGDWALNLLFPAVLLGYIAIAVVNALVMATASRVREFAMLRLIGAGRDQVRAMMNGEARIVAVAALLFGLLAAVPPLVGMSLGLTGSPFPSISLVGLITIGALTGTLSWGAIALATRFAMRPGPIDAIGGLE